MYGRGYSAEMSRATPSACPPQKLERVEDEVTTLVELVDWGSRGEKW